MSGVSGSDAFRDLVDAGLIDASDVVEPNTNKPRDGTIAASGSGWLDGGDGDDLYVGANGSAETFFFDGRHDNNDEGRHVNVVQGYSFADADQLSFRFDGGFFRDDGGYKIDQSSNGNRASFESARDLADLLLLLNEKDGVVEQLEEGVDYTLGANGKVDGDTRDALRTDQTEGSYVAVIDGHIVMNFDDGNANGETVDMFGNYLTNDVVVVFEDFEATLAAQFATELGYSEFASNADSVHILGQDVGSGGLVDPSPHSKSGGNGDNLFIMSNQADTIEIDDRDTGNDEGGHINIIHGFDLELDTIAARFDGGFFAGSNTCSFTGAAGLRALLTYARDIDDSTGDLVFTLQPMNSSRDPLTIVITGITRADIEAIAPPITPPTVAAPLFAAGEEDGPNLSLKLLEGASDTDASDRLVVKNLSLVSGDGAGAALSADGTRLVVDTTAYQSLASGQTETIVFEYDIVDIFGLSLRQTAMIEITGANDDPTLVAGTAEALEDGATISIDLSALGDDLDSDNDGSNLVYQVIAGPTEGMASISGAALTFDPGTAFQDMGAGDTRNIAVTVQATDAHGATATNDILITITGTNDTPVVADLIWSAVAENGFIGGGVQSAVFDPDGDPLIYDFASASVLGGSITGYANGGFTYSGNSDQIDALAEGELASDFFSFTVSDGQGGSASGVFEVRLTGVNDAPELVASSASVSEDGATVTVDLSALADDIDSDDDGRTLSYSISGNPSDGVASITGTSLTYDPAGDFGDLAAEETRDVVIQVTATDAHGSTATNEITITVTGTNGAPVFEEGDPPSEYMLAPAPGYEDRAIVAVPQQDNGQFSESLLAVLENGNVVVSSYDVIPTSENTTIQQNVLTVLSAEGEVINRVPFVFRPAPAPGQALSPQRYPADVVALSDGGFAALWSATDALKVPAYSGHIRIQFFNADGTERGPEEVFFTDKYYEDLRTTSNLQLAGSAGLDNGRFVIAIRESEQDENDRDNYNLRLVFGDSQGNIRSIEVLESGPARHYGNMSLERTIDGGVMVVWRETHPDPAGGFIGHLMAQVFSPEGVPLSNAELIDTSGGGALRYSGTQLSDGRHVVVSEGSDGFVVAFLDENCVPTGDEVVLAAPGAGADPIYRNIDPDVVALDGGHFAIAWSTTQISGGNETFVQVVDGSGNLVGDRIAVGADLPSFSVYDAEIVISKDGVVTVLWEEFNGSDPERNGLDFAIKSFVLPTSGPETEATITELPDGDSEEGTAVHIANGILSFSDPDGDDMHLVSVTPLGADYRGTMTAEVSHPAGSGMSGEVTWNFSVEDALLGDLDAGDVMEQEYLIELSDGAGSTTSTSVTVTLEGAVDVPIEDGPLHVWPPELDFGLIFAGSYRRASVPIENPTEQTIVIDEVALTGDTDTLMFNGGEYPGEHLGSPDYDDVADYIFEPGEESYVTFRFEPLSAGSFEAEFELKYYYEGELYSDDMLLVGRAN